MLIGIDHKKGEADRTVIGKEKRNDNRFEKKTIREIRKQNKNMKQNKKQKEEQKRVGWKRQTLSSFLERKEQERTKGTDNNKF